MPDLPRKELKIIPPGDSNTVQDVLDEIYEVLYRRGYAITQGRWGQHTLIVLSELREGGRRLAPVAQIAQIIPDHGQLAAKGIDWRKVDGDKAKPEIVQ